MTTGAGMTDTTGDAAAAVRRPWLPPALAAVGHDQGSVGVLSYVVVDEIVDAEVTLAVADWPDADGDGRLRFHDLAARRHVVAGLAQVREQLYARARRGDEPVRRNPRIGDVFAAAVPAAAQRRLAAARDDVEWDDDLATLLPDPIHDLAAEAREAAKLAFYGAAAAVLDTAEADRRRLTEDLPPLPPAEPTAGAPTPLAWQLPADLLSDGDFVAACRQDPQSLVYFVLNVGDGDTQLLLLPADAQGRRRAIVVDVATTRKLPALLADLIDAELLAAGRSDAPAMLPLVVATHPHDDHIGGLRELLDVHGDDIHELWEPGYVHPSDVYIETMVALESRRGSIRHLQPTSGLTCYLDQVKLTVVAPGIGLRSRFDSYGTQINDASLALKVEFPATRIVRQPDDDEPRHANRVYVRNDPWALLLGADAQTTAWAQATVDFPEILGDHNPVLARELRLGAGRDPLRAHVFKLPHHASKHGLNLELVTRVSPQLSLVSCRAHGRYGFPHELALEAVREALVPVASRGGTRPPDHDLGIHYTCAVAGSGHADDAAPLGSLAVIVSPKRRTPLQLWRFGDEPRDTVRLQAARRMVRTAAR